MHALLHQFKPANHLTGRLRWFQACVTTATTIASHLHTTSQLLKPGRLLPVMEVSSALPEMDTRSSDPTTPMVNSGTALSSTCAPEPSHQMAPTSTRQLLPSLTFLAAGAQLLPVSTAQAQAAPTSHALESTTEAATMEQLNSQPSRSESLPLLLQLCSELPQL